MNLTHRFWPTIRSTCTACMIVGLSLIPSTIYAEGTVLDKAIRMFQDEWTKVAENRKKPSPIMLQPSTHITITFTYYQVDIPTYGLKSVDFRDGQVYINYLNGTGIIMSLQRKYHFPPDVWGLKLDTVIACMMNQKDHLPPEYAKTTPRFKEIRNIFWRGVAWTKNRKRGIFNIYQMYREYAFLEPNTAYMIREGGNIEAVLLHGTIDTEIFTKIVDSIRYRF